MQNKDPLVSLRKARCRVRSSQAILIRIRRLKFRRQTPRSEVTKRLVIHLRRTSHRLVFDRAPGMQDDHLRIAAVGHVSEETRPKVLVLVDTGAQISLIRKGLIPSGEMQPMSNPIRLLTASKQLLRGGEKQVKVDLIFNGVCEDTGEEVQVVAPTLLCEAEISDDVIVSYTWLGERGFEISPRKHGMLCQVGDTRIWVSGLPAPEQNPTLVPIQVRRTSVQEKLALDLFSGTGSATRVLQSHGYRVISVDHDSKWEPTLQKDVLTWDYRNEGFPPGAFEIIVAAPPCTEFSLALTTRPRCLGPALELVEKTLEIIRYFQPDRWWLETPATGKLAKATS